MKGDVGTAAHVMQQAVDYGTAAQKTLGFSLKLFKS
jgi:hypothetical protein